MGGAGGCGELGGRWSTLIGAPGGGCRVGGERESGGRGVAGGLIEAGAEAGEGVAGGVPLPDPESPKADGQEQEDCRRPENRAKVETGELEHEEIDPAMGRWAGGGGVLELGDLAELGFEIGDERGRLELENAGVGPDEAADIDGGRERPVISAFEGADVIGLDFGELRDFVDGPSTGLPRAAQLFGDRGHRDMV